MTLKMAVIGVGAMGRNHARVCNEIPDVELIAVADVDSAVALRVGELYRIRSYSDHSELLSQERPDAVSVAVPTQGHYRVVMDALHADCHVLVEKPIATTVEEGRELIEAARARNLLLMVGHIERFNPAVIELKRRIVAGELGRVFQIHARRLGPFPTRIRDVGVVVDLATHDIDVMRYLTEAKAVRVYAETKREVHVSNEDMLTGLVRFDDGTLGVLEINWLTPTKIRELYVTGERGLFLVNYLTQDLYFYENEDANGTDWGTLSVLRGVSEGQMVRYKVRKVEPLRAELEAFASAIRGNCQAIVTGTDGVEALRLAHAILKSGEQHLAIVVNDEYPMTG